jgi:hypothetical protein
MSAAETLRKASELLRHDVEFGNGAAPYAEALADWLDFATGYRNTAHIKPALAVARLILGGRDE